MAFNVNQFKSSLHRFGGPAHNGLFQVIFTNTPSLPGTSARSRDLSFFCKSVAIPSINLQTSEYQAVAARPKQFPTGITSEQVSAIFMLDSNHQILSFLHGWMQKVLNYSTSGGAMSEVDGMLPHEVGYKDEYSCRMIIRYYSTYNNVTGFGNTFNTVLNVLDFLSGGNYYEVVLDNAFPIAVGDVDLSWDNQNSFATVGVGFSYDEIKYDGERSGSPTARLGRGNGLLDLLTTVGVVSQMVGGDFRPTGVQDAINKLTRIDNAATQLNGLFGN